MEYLYIVSKIIVTLIYSLSLTLLCIYGLHRYYLCYVYWTSKRKKIAEASLPGKLPAVTVQLPIYNEMYVAKRLISSVCALDYPKELLEIQVLDDSTDRTSEIASDCVCEFRKKGFDVKYIHRSNREGFKAGALSAGLEKAKGELVAVFDADFVPPEDFLLKTVPYFCDPGIGIVQARWGHINRDYSALTKAQSILLDGHFIIEQTSRYKGGMFFNFNGTAGVLRRECIESSGGWQHDTLTEDLDLSYRAQLKGWKLVYLKDLVVNAELPVDMNSFKSQQHRWVKGGVQTAFKILPRIISRPELSLNVKKEAVFHLLGNISYLLLLILLFSMFPLGYFWDYYGFTQFMLMNLLAISAGTLSFFFFYIYTVREAFGKNWLSYLKYVPLAIATGIGLSINNAKAVLEAFSGKSSEFVRTPKFALTDRRDIWKFAGYRSAREITSYLEMAAGLIFFGQTAYAIYMGYFSWIPFLLLIQAGFLYTGLMSIGRGHGSGKSGSVPGTVLPRPFLRRE